MDPDLPTEAERASLRDVAERVCAEASELVRRGLVAGPHPDARPEAVRKGPGDFVTPLDHEVEEHVSRRLAELRPRDGFLGEETGTRDPDAEFVWVVDPIDGTSNFASGLAHFAVSIACLYAGRPVAAAIQQWPEDVTWSAAAGLGTTYAGRPQRVPEAPRAPDAAVFGVQWFRIRTGSPWTFLAALADTGARIRVLGSSVTQICDVALGRHDANVQEQGKLWDLAAAALVALEAGALVTDWHGAPIFPLRERLADAGGAGRHYPSLIAPPATHARVLPLLSAHARAEGSDGPG